MKGWVYESQGALMNSGLPTITNEEE